MDWRMFVGLALGALLLLVADRRPSDDHELVAAVLADEVEVGHQPTGTSSWTLENTRQTLVHAPHSVHSSSSMQGAE